MKPISTSAKFRLLIWKNWIIQTTHMWQLIAEIVLPLLFCLLIVLLRITANNEKQESLNYAELPINTLELFNKYVHNSKPPKPLIVYSPSTNLALKRMMEEAASGLRLEALGARDASELVQLVLTHDGIAGAQFPDDLAQSNDMPDILDLVLRFPSELRCEPNMNWPTRRLWPYRGGTGSRESHSDDGGSPSYLREGFLPIQNAISMSYLRLKSGQPLPQDIFIQRYPYPPYIVDKIINHFYDMVSFIILLCFIFPVAVIARNITTEKELQLKEVMKTMGLDSWLHWTAWFVKCIIKLMIISILIIMLLKISFNDNGAILPHSRIDVLILLFFVYSTSMICYAFMMSTFFNRATTAAAVTGMVWFLLYIPYMITKTKYGTMMIGSKIGLCLIFNTAIGYIMNIIIGFEVSGEGLNWVNLFSDEDTDDVLTVGVIMIIMLFSSLIYLLIALYVELVFPGAYGIGQKWYFLFTKSFWCRRQKQQDDNIIDLSYQNPDFFESDLQGKRIGIQIKNLKKKYNNKFVVKGISLNMYEDQITVLLGHNGAGKTTTIAMLTGIIQPTSGTAIINGYDLSTNIRGVRQSLGICPQQNVIFEDMSVANHLRFYSRLKGLPVDKVEEEVEKYLHLINLEHKARTVTGQLSGGMKRKVSLCCALCGDAKVVLCDEPSSGLDPSARRELWNLLLKEKTGRTILLTTHFMDEADVLGDRIAIMCDGELKCNGTSFFLKKKFGSGHRLILAKEENCDSAQVTALLSKYIPGIQPASDVGSELYYNLPDEYLSKFESMFEELERRLGELNVSGFGVGNTSLEEVFMKMGAEQLRNDDDNPDEFPFGKDINESEDKESAKYKTGMGRNVQSVHGCRLVANQWLGMMYKNMLYTYRHKALFIAQNVLPIIFVVAAVLIARSEGFNSTELPPLKISMLSYTRGVTVMEKSTEMSDNTENNKYALRYKELAQSYGPRYKFESTEAKTFSDYILHLGETKQPRVDRLYLVAATFEEMKIIAWLNNQYLHLAPLTVNLVHNAIARELIGEGAEIRVTNHPLPFRPETLLNGKQTSKSFSLFLAVNVMAVMCFVTPIYLMFLIEERTSDSQLLQFTSGARGWIFWTSHLLWDLLTFSLTALIAVLTLACFQEDDFSTFSELGRYFSVLVIFGLFVLPVMYFLSLFSNDPANGYAWVAVMNVFIGLALFQIITLMNNILVGVKDSVDLFAIIYPLYALAENLHQLGVNQMQRRSCQKIEGMPIIIICEILPTCCELKGYYAWEAPGILQGISYLSIVGTVTFLYLLLRSHGFFEKFKCKKTPSSPPQRFDVDDDIAKEEEIIAQMSSAQRAETNLVLDRVTKFYSNFLAVNQLSLRVREGECFGLLGVNGAGKTTTFKMMTGAEKISLGHAYVQGISLRKNIYQVYKKIGYCPQYNATLDILTGRENLKLFCLLRGIDRANIASLSQDLARSFGFFKHLNKVSKKYSGGNKRKLSAAVAVIGSPVVVYMDEPTTGMDPAARRHMWNIVCRIRDSGTSIVLTSHSMEECEALCTRLAIMVNGQLMCIGSGQHLKNKFSKGFVLKIKLKQIKIPRKRPMSPGNTTPMQYRPSKASLITLDENASPTPLPYKGSIEDMVEHQRMKSTGPTPTHRVLPDTISVYSDEGEEVTQQDVNKVKNFIKKQYPDSVLQDDCHGILSYYIPLQGLKWSEIFGVMHRNRHELYIEDYSITQTTLEEVFLEFAKHQNEAKRKAR